MSLCFFCVQLARRKEGWVWGKKAEEMKKWEASEWAEQLKENDRLKEEENKKKGAETEAKKEEPAAKQEEETVEQKEGGSE